MSESTAQSPTDSAEPKGTRVRAPRETKRPRSGERRSDRSRRDGGRRLAALQGPPRFNVDELAALAGAPVWQAVHSATVLDVSAAAVLVEVKPLEGAPVKAAIPPAEAQGSSVGASVRVRLGDPPKGGEVPTASIAQAAALDALDGLLQAQERTEPVSGAVVREVKGGYSVALLAKDEQQPFTEVVRAFLPASQSSLARFGARPTEVVGTVGTFDIVELEPERGNVVVSRKARLAADRKAAVEARLGEIKEGDIVKATVKTVVAYGAFLDIGGLDAMVHQSDLTWDGRARAAEVLKPGQIVDVKVLHKNADTGKVKVGIKQTQLDPWAELRAAFADGSIVEGTVVALADFGAFVRLEVPTPPGHAPAAPVEGLIHVSEIAWTKVKHPSQRFKIGDVVKVKVLGLDADARRISLSSRALEQNPFEAVAEKLPVGTVVKAKVKSLTDFGAFVELGDGIDGLIHVGEISWTAHPHHPSELLNIGQDVEAVVVNIDVSRQRVGLSIKRAQPNPYDAWEKKYHKGARLTLKVARVDDKGAWLQVEDGLTCFCFVKDLVGKEGDGRVERAQDAVKMGQEIDVEVKNFDRRFNKVSVSMRAVVEGDTREAYDDYKKKEAAEGQKLNPLADKLKGLQVKAAGSASAADKKGE